VGTRLRPHTYTIPKPLLPVAGKPIIDHILEPLAALEPEEVVFVVGHLGDQIVDYVRKNFGFRSVFVRQTDLLGLGFAIHLALEEMASSPVMVILGDTIARTDYGRFADGEKNVIGLKQVDDPRRFGIAVIEDGRIVALEEKPERPRSDMALIGLYFFEDSGELNGHLEKLIESGKKTSGEIQLTDALEMMIQAGHDFRPYLVDDWYDCGKKETILETNRLILDESQEPVDWAGSEIIEPVAIAADAEVTDSVIGPHVSISAGVRIKDSVVRDSIICAGAEIERCMLDQSIIGGGAVIREARGILNIGDSSEITIHEK